MEMQVTEAWKDRDDWRFLYDSRPNKLEKTKEEEEEEEC